MEQPARNDHDHDLSPEGVDIDDAAFLDYLRSRVNNDERSDDLRAFINDITSILDYYYTGDVNDHVVLVHINNADDTVKLIIDAIKRADKHRPDDDGRGESDPAGEPQS